MAFASPIPRPDPRTAAWAGGLGALAVVATWLLPSGLPLGIAARGVVLGSLAGLLAMGVVFVYRANAIISFAQGELGAFAATLAYELIIETGVPYLLAVPICVAAAVVLSATIEVLVLRRFARASRLIATVVTIGIAQLMLFLQLVIPLVFERYSTEVGAGRLAFPSPFKKPAFTLSGVIFSQDVVVVLIVVPVVLVGLVVFFRRSWIGIAIRGAAQNGDRAGLLGIPVARLGTVSWALAGGLSGLAAILRAPITGYFPGDLGGASLLARALAAAAIGRFESIGVTFAAAVGIAVVEQAYTYNFSQSAPLDGLVLAILVVALVFRRGRTGRAAWGDVSSWQSVKEVRPVPREIRALAELRWARAAVTLLGLVVVLALPLVVGTSRIRLLSVVWIFAIVAMSLVVLTGWAGQVSLGQWALVGIGAVVTGKLATLEHPPSFIVIVVLSAAVAGAASVLLGLPALRLQGLFYGVTTLAFAVAAGGWLFKLPAVRTLDQVPRPVLGGSIALDTERRFYYVVIGVALCCLLAVRNLRRSRAGRLLVATRDNPRAVATFGARVAVARLSAFGVAGSLCGVAGSLYVTLVQTVEPSDFAADRSILLFGMAVIGGLGSLAGGVLGALYVLGSQYFLPSWGSFLATGLGVVVFLMVFPGGLGQLFYAARDRFLALLAERHGIDLPSMVADRRAPTRDDSIDVLLAGVADEAPAVESPARPRRSPLSATGRRTDAP
jgi:branched-chain amino acid transport system permease protein